MKERRLKFLIVVDLQNSFCPGGELAVPDGDQIVPYVNELMLSGVYDRCIASKESHPREHGSFASQYPGKNSYLDSIEIGSVTQTLWPDHCVAGTRGEEFNPYFKINLVDKVVIKGTDPLYHSFSSFWIVPGKEQTDLLSYILKEAQAEGVDAKNIDIDVVGLALDYCVRDTAIDAAKFGLNVTLLLAGTRAVNVSSGDDLKAIKFMEDAGVNVVAGRAVPLLAHTDFKVERHLVPAITPGM